MKYVENEILWKGIMYIKKMDENIFVNWADLLKSIILLYSWFRENYK